MNAVIDVTNIQIETERLILRPWRETDLLDFFAYASVDGVGQMAGWEPHKTIDDSKKILSMFIEGKKTLALELKESGKVIGSIGIEKLSPDLEDRALYGREIGYALSKDFWGRGLMPEAVCAVVDYCFNILNYDYLTCGHFEWNSQSRRVIEKTGFRYVSKSPYETSRGTQEISLNYIQYNPKLER